jgi:ligand-binding sensor domain-containing protein
MHVNGFIQKDSTSVWVLSSDLLLILNLRTQQLSQPVQPMIKGYDWGLNNYSSFVKDNNNNLWIGTPLHGIICYNIEQGTSEIYADGNKDPITLLQPILLIALRTIKINVYGMEVCDHPA